MNKQKENLTLDDLPDVLQLFIVRYRQLSPQGKLAMQDYLIRHDNRLLIRLLQ